MTSGAEIVAIHGFLGLASDWEPFGYRGVDLWPSARALEARDDGHDDAFALWAKRFNEREIGPRKPWLLGYSLGGRLAMQAVLSRPELYRGMIVISANPGLASEAERRVRLENDLAWAARFRDDQTETKPERWDEVVAAWNSQPVLAPPPGAAASADSRTERDAAKFDRVALAAALDIWSLGRQRDLRQELTQLDLPVLFIAGEHDTKFVGLMQSLNLGKNHERLVIPGAAHRVPWDRPRELAEAVRAFTSRER